MVAILFGFPMVLNKIAVIFLEMEHHWKTEQRVTIGIQDTFGGPAPTIIHFNFGILKLFVMFFQDLYHIRSSHHNAGMFIFTSPSPL